MNKERSIRVAIDLQLIGVSQAGVVELLSNYSLDEIEKQLEYLPHRKAKRPEAFIIEAIRHNYSPPKELYYAKTETEPTPSIDPLDSGSEQAVRSPTSTSQGYGATDSPPDDSPNPRMETREPTDHFVLPNVKSPNGEEV